MKAKTFEQQILAWLARPGYRPLKQHELARALGVTERVIFRRTLYALERAGRIVCLRKNRYALPPPAKEKLRGAAAEAPRSAIIVGRLMRNPYYWYVMPDQARRRAHNVRVREFAATIKPVDGHIVVLRLDEAPHAEEQPVGVVIEDLGRAETPGVDMLRIIRRREFATDFPLAARSQAAHTTVPPAPALRADGRRDLRDWTTFTIDPDDAKDFDDALSLTALPDGRWQLGVHIADVSHYVTPDSPIDREARERGNTIYLVDRAITMLPPNLTADICSLLPQQDRLTHSAMLTFDRHHRVESVETFPAVIHSAARLTYGQVELLFEGHHIDKIPSVVREPLLQLRPLAREWRKRRLQHGALDLAVPEVKCIMDAHGYITAIKQRGDAEAYQMIEECMLLANVAVAERLRAGGGPALYRIHDEPDAEQWDEMREALRALGAPMIPATPDDLNKLLHRVAGTPLAATLNLIVVRCLKRAMYSAELRPHFGLAFPRYTHFTSPIRRYPDLVVHRLLKAVEQSAPPPYTKSALARLATHCSTAEKAADEAENESVEVKRVAYYEEKLRRGDIGPFAGVVTGLLGKGLMVELRDSLQRGLLPFAALKNDYYEMNAARTHVKGKRRGGGWKIGQPLEVVLTRVDTANRWMDFALP
ncbi:MAG: VacB/RNase II family 3'-5' exoribonuclease [Verrucomicrobia bacterium]|nr:MAG: VacB/RNase II family 3'-5' exoribonuclease [Verrucomicrobiota bacterium]